MGTGWRLQELVTIVTFRDNPPAASLNYCDKNVKNVAAFAKKI
jgi:hypothetical protein